MRHQRLMNTHSLILTQEILDLLGNLIPDDQKRDAFEELFALMKNGLEAFCIEQDCLTRRLNPLSPN